MSMWTIGIQCICSQMVEKRKTAASVRCDSHQTMNEKRHTMNFMNQTKILSSVCCRKWIFALKILLPTPSTNLKMWLLKHHNEFFAVVQVRYCVLKLAWENRALWKSANENGCAIPKTYSIIYTIEFKRFRWASWINIKPANQNIMTLFVATSTTKRKESETRRILFIN